MKLSQAFVAAIAATALLAGTGCAVVRDQQSVGTYIDDSVLPCSGWANLHVWRFSEDGGANPAVFHNNSNFHFCADLVITGEGAIDRSSLMGKGPGELVQTCLKLRTPCLGLAGHVLQGDAPAGAAAAFGGHCQSTFTRCAPTKRTPGAWSAGWRGCCVPVAGWPWPIWTRG